MSALDRSRQDVTQALWEAQGDVKRLEQENRVLARTASHWRAEALFWLGMVTVQLLFGIAILMIGGGR